MEGFGRKLERHQVKSAPSRASPGVMHMHMRAMPGRLLRYRRVRDRCGACQKAVGEELLKADALYRIPPQQAMQELLARR